MTDMKNDVDSGNNGQINEANFTWPQKVGLSVKTPIGLFGIGLTTVCITLTILGLLGHITGLIENPYAEIVTFLVFPSGAVFGLFLIPVSGYLRRKKWFKDNLNKGNVIIDFGKKSHRKTVILFLVLSVVNLYFLSLVIY
jgi:hypothetical protein